MTPRIAIRKTRRRRARASIAAGLFLLVGGAAPSWAQQTGSEAKEHKTPPAVTETERSKRLREVNRQLERDQQRLIELISEPPGITAPPLRENTELRELAVRVPRLQEERRRLLEGPTPPSLPPEQP